MAYSHIEDDVGAKSTTNGKTCDVNSEDPLPRSFLREKWSKHTHWNICESRDGVAVTSCFWCMVATEAAGRNRQKWHEDCIFVNQKDRQFDFGRRIGMKLKIPLIGTLKSVATLLPCSSGPLSTEALHGEGS